jgi:hypothetical protein
MQQKTTTLPSAVWFVFSETGEPLGQVYRNEGEHIPAVGAQLAEGPKWKRAEVMDFAELRATCAIRRFRVVIRVLQ